VKFKRPRIRIARIIAAAVFALGIALPVSAAIPAAAAQASSCSQVPWKAFGDWYLPYGCSGLLPASHVCVEYPGVGMVNGSAIQPIQCADIAYKNVDYNNGFDDSGELWGEGEFYCQGEATECQGMNVSVYDKVENSSGTDYTSPNSNYKCNPDVGFCPDGGRVKVSTQHFAASRGKCYFASSVDPADDENGDGDPQVISVEEHAFHAESELPSNTTELCFR
jgi:hypothetical protein